MNRENYRFSIDDAVVDYLIEKGYKEFLVNDVSFGPQLGGLPEKALCSFTYGQVFNGKAGRFKLREQYGPMSARSFYAWLA